MTPTRTPQQVSIDARAARTAWENGKPIECSPNRNDWINPKSAFTPAMLDDYRLFWRPSPRFWTVYGLNAPDWAETVALDSEGEVTFCEGPMKLSRDGNWRRVGDEFRQLWTGVLCHGVDHKTSLLTRP